MNKTVVLEDLGVKDYKETWTYQESLFDAIVNLKIRNRREELHLETPNYFLFVISSKHSDTFVVYKSNFIFDID